MFDVTPRTPANGRFRATISLGPAPASCPTQSMRCGAHAESNRKFLNYCVRRLVRVLGQPKTI